MCCALSLPLVSPKKAQAELARRHLADFVTTTKPDYTFSWHHRRICEALDDFAAGRIMKLMIFAPPQHGKSELSTRRLPAYLLGKNPRRRIAIISYSATLAEGFNRDIQRIIDDTVYHDIFPDTVLNESNVVTDVKSGFLRNSTMFETVPHRGSVRTVGVEGSLTGFPVDVALFDDLYKSREEALSTKRQETIKSFYESVLIPRLHNDSQQLLTFTRWCEDDLAGYLLSKENDWTVITLPAIKEHEDATDPRAIGEALWPERHSVERIMAIRESTPAIFNALYQQQPGASKEVLVFPDFEIIDNMPEYVSGCGIDFGFSNDPCAVVNVSVHNQSLYLDEIVYETGLINSEIKDRMVSAGVNLRSQHVADSAEPKSIKELLTIGVNVVPCTKGPDSIHYGISEMQKMKLHVTRRSRNLINELKNYQFRVVAGKKTNEPIGPDHAIDAARYKFTHLKTKPKIKL